MILPKTGVTTTIVAEALSSSSRDVGTLCTHPSINIWSKWKPVAYNTKDEITLAQLKQVNYGMSIESSHTPLSLYNKVKLLTSPTHWYDGPTGISTKPYRIGDFREYRKQGGGIVTYSGHSSQLPRKVDIGVAVSNNQPVIMGYDGIEVEPEEGLVSYADLYPTGARRGILLINGSDSYWTTGILDWNSFEIKGWRGSTTAFIFYTTVDEPTLKPGGWAPGGATFYPAMRGPGSVNPYEIEITTEAGSGSLPYIFSSSAVYDAFNGGPRYNMVFSAKGSTTKGGTLRNVEAHLYVGGVRRRSKFHDASFTLVNNTDKEYKGIFQWTEPGSLEIRFMENRQEIGSTMVMIPMLPAIP